MQKFDFTKFETIEQATAEYKELLKKYHPDKIKSELGLSVEQLTEISAQINTAYDDFKEKLLTKTAKVEKVKQKASIRQKMAKMKKDFNDLPEESQEKVFNIVDNGASFIGDLLKNLLRK